MKKFSILLGVIFLFAMAQTARAAMVGVVPTDQVANLMAGKEVSYDLFSLKGTTFTDFKTTIHKTNGSQVWKVDNAVYFNDTDGLYTQTIGSTAAKKIKSQKFLEGELFLGKNWLISNKGTTDKGQSFFFNIQTKKVTKFQPTIGTIAGASATADNSKIVMIAKNSKGKQKLWLSTTSTTQLVEFPLPPHAKSCTGLAIAPKGKTMAMGCTFTVTGSSTAKDGYVIYSINNNQLKLVTSVIKNDSIGQLIWLNDQTAIMVANVSSGNVEVHKLVITKGKITSDKTLLSNGTADVSGSTISYAPFQLLRWVDNKFYYNTLYVYVTNTDAYLSFINSYDLNTKQQAAIVDNNNFVIFL